MIALRYAVYHFKKAIWAGLAGLISFIFVQALFYPDILHFWATWLPESLSPFLNGYRFESEIPYSFGERGTEALSTYRIFLYLFAFFFTFF